jgi:hypothetical protein
LSNKLTSAASLGVDVLFTFYVHISVFDPGHNLFVGAHVGSETINSSANKAFLNEFHGVFTGDTLKLTLREQARVDFNSTLAATKWHVCDSEFESHQRSKSFNLLKIDVVGVSSATLAGELVSRMLGSIAGDGLEFAVVSAKRYVESDNCLAGLNEVKIFWVDSSLGRSGSEEKFDLFEETRLAVGVKAWSRWPISLRYGSGG